MPEQARGLALRGVDLRVGATGIPVEKGLFAVKPVGKLLCFGENKMVYSCRNEGSRQC